MGTWKEKNTAVGLGPNNGSVSLESHYRALILPAVEDMVNLWHGHKNGFLYLRAILGPMPKTMSSIPFPALRAHSDERAHIIRETKRPVHNCVGKEYHCMDKDKEN